MAEAGHVEGGAADASATPSRTRRVIHIVLAVLVAFVVPVLQLDAFVGPYGANAMFSAFWSAPWAPRSAEPAGCCTWRRRLG
jgi:nitrate reductase NapE component